METAKIQQLAEEYQELAKGVINYERYTWYAISHHSTAIEGSTLTEKQSIDLLEFGKTAAKKPMEDHLMLLDYYNALQFTLKTASEKNPVIYVTADLLRTIASKVKLNTGETVNSALGTFDTAKGDFRLCSVRAGTRLFPDCRKVPDMVKKLCNNLSINMINAKTFEEKCSLAFQAHFELVSIHPFGDGNGRTSRLLMNFVQAHFNLPLSIVYKQDRLKYIEALENARKKEDIEPFLKFMYRQYAKFLKEEIARLKQ
jgi:Fic family protein